MYHVPLPDKHGWWIGCSPTSFFLLHQQCSFTLFKEGDLAFQSFGPLIFSFSSCGCCYDWKDVNCFWWWQRGLLMAINNATSGSPKGWVDFRPDARVFDCERVWFSGLTKSSSLSRWVGVVGWDVEELSCVRLVHRWLWWEEIWGVETMLRC